MPDEETQWEHVGGQRFPKQEMNSVIITEKQNKQKKHFMILLIEANCVFLFPVLTNWFLSADRFDFIWSLLKHWWFKTVKQRSIKSHQSLPHYHHSVLTAHPKYVSVCASVCSVCRLNGRKSEPSRSESERPLWSPKTKQGEKLLPLTERIKYPWVGTSQLSLTTLLPLLPPLLPLLPSSSCLPWLSLSLQRGWRERSANEEEKRRGGKIRGETVLL